MPAANNGCDVVGAGTDAFAVVCEYDGRFRVVLELVALSAFVLLLRYAVAALYYANHRLATLGAHDDDLRAAASSRSDGGAAASPSPSGLDDAAIAQLPCFVVEMSMSHGAGAAAAAAIATSTECAVCLGAVEEGETARALPSCAHAFHARCIDAWLRLRATCPVCRATCRCPLVLKIR